MTVAIAADWLSRRGGAERFVEALLKAFPRAVATTTVADNSWATRWKGRVFPTDGFVASDDGSPHVRLGGSLVELARRTRISMASTTIISHHHVASLMDYRDCTRLVLYVHSPPRFLWQPELVPWEARHWANLDLRSLRAADKRLVKRADLVWTNSSFTAARISAFYDVEAAVLPPPVNVSFFSASATTPKKSLHALAVARITPGRNIAAAAQACASAGIPLKVGGTGRDLPRLRSDFPQVEFLGELSDEALRQAYGRASVFVNPAVDDFGIAAAEALAAGIPVVALRESGQVDVVEHGRTGFLVEDASPATLAFGISRALALNTQAEIISASVESFDNSRFIQRVHSNIDQ